MVILVTDGCRGETWWRWSSTYVVGLVAVFGRVDIMDIDDLGEWLPGWYVVEDDNDFRWRRM